MNKYEKLVQQTYALMGQGKIEEFKSHLSGQISWTETAGYAYAGTFVGPDEVIKNVHQRLGTEWDNFTAKDELYASNNNIVMVYGKYSGTYKLTGKYFTADFCHIYEFDENDKVKKFVQVVDSATVNNAMI